MKQVLVYTIWIMLSSCSNKEITVVYYDCTLLIKSESENICIGNISLGRDSSTIIATIKDPSNCTSQFSFCKLDSNAYTLYFKNSLNLKDSSRASMNLNIMKIHGKELIPYGYYHVSFPLKDTTFRLGQMKI